MFAFSNNCICISSKDEKFRFSEKITDKFDLNSILLKNINKTSYLYFGIDDPVSYTKCLISFYKTIFNSIELDVLFDLYKISLLDSETNSSLPSKIDELEFIKIAKSCDKYDIYYDKFLPYFPIEFYISAYLSGNINNIFINNKLKLFFSAYIDSIYCFFNASNSMKNIVHKISKNSNWLKVDSNANIIHQKVLSLKESIFPDNYKLLCYIDNALNTGNFLDVFKFDIELLEKYLPEFKLSISMSVDTLNYSINEYLLEYIYDLYIMNNIHKLSQLTYAVSY